MLAFGGLLPFDLSGVVCLLVCFVRFVSVVGFSLLGLLGFCVFLLIFGVCCFGLLFIVCYVALLTLVYLFCSLLIVCFIICFMLSYLLWYLLIWMFVDCGCLGTSVVALGSTVWVTLIERFWFGDLFPVFVVLWMNSFMVLGGGLGCLCCYDLLNFDLLVGLL